MVQITVILVGLVIVIIAIVVIIYLIERKLKQKLKKVSSRKANRYVVRLRRIKSKKQSPEQELEELNKLTKSFLKEENNLEQNLTYSSLKEILQKKGKYEEAEFCDLMNKEYYSKKQLTNKEIKKIVYSLEKIIKKN